MRVEIALILLSLVTIGYGTWWLWVQIKFHSVAKGLV